MRGRIGDVFIEVKATRLDQLAQRGDCPLLWPTRLVVVGRGTVALTLIPAAGNSLANLIAKLLSEVLDARLPTVPTF